MAHQVCLGNVRSLGSKSLGQQLYEWFESNYEEIFVLADTISDVKLWGQ